MISKAIFIAAVAATSSEVVSAQGPWPLPKPWYNQHTHFEIMYVPDLGTTHLKPIHYDFTNKAYRADVVLAPGSFPNPLSPINQTSYWLEDNLYIYDYFPFPSCVLLNLGFGMMVPSWFLGGTQNGTVYSLKHYPYSSGDDGMYVNTLWTSNPVPGEGNFDYFSFLNTTSAGAAIGDPHHFSAPSPLGLVVNELNNMTATTFQPGDPIFALPAGISCVNTTISDPFEAVRHHAPHFYTEILMAALGHGML